MVKARRVTPISIARKPRRLRPCYLQRLPPELISQILADAELELAQVALSKRLLPFTLEALYRNVQIYSELMLVRFAASIRAQPQLARIVKNFGLSGRDDPPDNEGGDSDDESDDSDWSTDDWARPSKSPENGRSDAGQRDKAPTQVIFGMGRVVLDTQPAPYEPDRLRPDDALLRDLLRRLTSLEQVLLFGRARLCAVLDEPFLREGALDSVNTFRCHLNGSEDWDDAEAVETCRRLQLLPSLDLVGFGRNYTGMPLSLDNTLPRYRLEPRSWTLTTVTFDEMSEVGPSIKHLFASLKPGFKRLRIEALRCYDGLARDMALVPSTVEIVDINFGSRCWIYDGGPIPSFDNVFTPARFPHLKHLHIGGPLLDATHIPSLGDLPTLKCLALGFHLPLSGAALLSLLEKGSLPIKHLALQICACPDPTRRKARPRPRWHAEFGSADARTVWRAAERAGVEIDGSITCAIKKCDLADGHACWRE